VRFVLLEPTFLRFIEEKTYEMTDEIALADGVSFVCPKCFVENGMKRPGVHSVICWSPKVPKTTSPQPGRWNLKGSGYEDLSLVAGSSSVLLKGGCNAHFHVTNGNVTNCDKPAWP
jgi:hypothetical protein